MQFVQDDLNFHKHLTYNNLQTEIFQHPPNIQVGIVWWAIETFWTRFISAVILNLSNYIYLNTQKNYKKTLYMVDDDEIWMKKYDNTLSKAFQLIVCSYPKETLRCKNSV